MGAGSGQTVLISGAGLGGTLMALYLARAGHQVQLYERRDDPRGLSGGRGRSINLALSTRGIHALDGVGLAETVLSRSVAMRGRMIHPLAGKLQFQPYGTREDQVIRSVSRMGLNIALLDAAEREPGVRLHFGKRTLEVDLDRPALVIEDTDSAERSEVQGDRLIGADGAFSAVRGRMQRLDRFDYSQDYLQHGYKELTIPALADGGFRMQPHALHIWPRGGFMMIALPNNDGSFTCTLFWPFDGEHGFSNLRDGDAVESYFNTHFPDAVPLMPDLRQDYLSGAPSALVTVRCRPWVYLDKVALLGDACHAIVPFYGQGANAAFEDCVVLDECLRRHGTDWDAAFAEYERRRKQHVDVLADLAIANFLEMRDHVSSRSFLFKKKCEKVLHRVFPFWFVPLYTMVTFSRTPYGEATERARRQWSVVRWVGGGLVAVVLLLIIVLMVARVS
jgi:kynurenine 3-monooxygenase